jgi:hypothetical protein
LLVASQRFPRKAVSFEKTFMNRSVSESRGQHASQRYASASTATPWPLWLRVLLSVALVFHFAVIALCYASNNSQIRSNLADTVLQWLQPYTIPMGWYVELAPLPLVSSSETERPTRVEVRSSQGTKSWKPLIDSTTASPSWRRLMTLVGALQSHEDSDGMSLIAHAISSKAISEGTPIDGIRFVASSDAASNSAASPGNAAAVDQVLFEAKILSAGPDDLTLVPILEPTRSVPVTPANPVPAATSATKGSTDAR